MAFKSYSWHINSLDDDQEHVDAAVATERQAEASTSASGSWVSMAFL